MGRRLLKHQLKALGGGPRLTILAELKKNRNVTVSEMARAINRSITVTSIHLAHLERLGIIKRRRRGRMVIYRLSVQQDPLVKHVLRLL